MKKHIDIRFHTGHNLRALGFKLDGLTGEQVYRSLGELIQALKTALCQEGYMTWEELKDYETKT